MRVADEVVARETEQAREARRNDRRALSAEYLRLLRGKIDMTVDAGYEDHTVALTPEVLRQVCRQVHRYDAKREGWLDFDSFSRLCAQIAARSLATPLSYLSLAALFSQADVTGSHHICASQWAWARTQLAALIEAQKRAQAEAGAPPAPLKLHAAPDAEASLASGAAAPPPQEHAAAQPAPSQPALIALMPPT